MEGRNPLKKKREKKEGKKGRRDKPRKAHVTRFHLLSIILSFVVVPLTHFVYLLIPLKISSCSLCHCSFHCRTLRVGHCTEPTGLCHRSPTMCNATVHRHERLKGTAPSAEITYVPRLLGVAVRRITIMAPVGRSPIIISSTRPPAQRMHERAAEAILRGDIGRAMHLEGAAQRAGRHAEIHAHRAEIYAHRAAALHTHQRGGPSLSSPLSPPAPPLPHGLAPSSDFRGPYCTCIHRASARAGPVRSTGQLRMARLQTLPPPASSLCAPTWRSLPSLSSHGKLPPPAYNWALRSVALSSVRFRANRGCSHSLPGVNSPPGNGDLRCSSRSSSVI